jgi:glycosyltransferase involved in cell wall biosynthesis
MHKTLKIFVPTASTLLTDHRGHGEGLIAWQLLCGLAARGHEIVACARRVDLRAAPPFEVIETGLASRWESIESIGYATKVGRIYARLGGRQRFDVAHWLFPQGAEEVLVAPRGVPFVVGPHFITWPTAGTRRRPGDMVRASIRPVFWVLHRRALSRASCLLVATPDAAAIFPRDMRSKVRVLPFGIDDCHLSPVVEIPLEPTIAFVGRLEPAKGIVKLVQALALVKERVPEATLVVAGEGPERVRVEEETTRLGLANSVRLLGHVSHEGIPDVLRSSMVVCLPSDGEPYGMALLEAMAVGRAVVTSDQGGPRFLLSGDQGEQTVASNDPTSLARGLVSLLADRQSLERIGRENRERVDSTFTLSRVIDELESIYEAVL